MNRPNHKHRVAVAVAKYNEWLYANNKPTREEMVDRAIEISQEQGVFVDFRTTPPTFA